MASSIEFHHETFPIPLYSVLINHKGKRIQEEYVSPYTKNSMHRMFSAVKSFDALAVCALASEGYLNLDDTIIQYFPDYLPENLHSFIADMTIQDLLDMRTCHSATTYKKDLSKNWTESFFTTAPDHRSGQDDGSSTYVKLFGPDQSRAQALGYIETARSAIEKYYDHAAIYRYLADLLEQNLDE